MPWEKKELMLLREEFVRQALNGLESISELCQKYGVSRRVGYKWIARYKEEGILGLQDRSRKPVGIPSRTVQTTRDLILALKDKHPAWGARKLRQVLINQGHNNLPAEATIFRILRDQGKTQELAARKPTIRFERETPNELWQMDFKGHFAIQDGKCHPLTILDDCSRYSLCLKACLREDEISVRNALEEVFLEYGLPEAMTMDNGSPWKGSPGQRFSKLTIWLMRLGIKIGHSRPYHPQTQGKDERFHRTLKEELLKYHNFKTIFDAQKNFDEWRVIYNHERPHEGINMLCPANKYHRSTKEYTNKLAPIEYREGDAIRKVMRGGEISLGRKFCFIGEAFRGEYVALRRRTEHDWDIYYVNTRLCSFSTKV